MATTAIRKGVTNQLFAEIKNNAPFNDSQWSAFFNINIRTLQRYKNNSSHVINLFRVNVFLK